MRNYKDLILIIYLTTTSLSSFLFAGENKQSSKEEKRVIKLLSGYFEQVDNKNTKDMLNYINLPLILHFDSQPIHVKTKEEFNDIFNVWKKTNKAGYDRTKIDKTSITEIFKDFMYVVDVSYSRIDSLNNVVNSKRSLYSFVRADKYWRLGFLNKKWKKWKIYMIQSLENQEVKT